MYLLDLKTPCIMALPDGIASAKGIVITTGENIYAGMIYSQDMTMEERAAHCKRVYDRITTEIVSYGQRDIWSGGNRTYGSLPSQKFYYKFLTKTSLRYLTNVWEAPKLRTILPSNRIKKESTEAILNTTHHQLHDNLLAEEDWERPATPAKTAFLNSVHEEAYSKLQALDCTDMEKRVHMELSLTPLGLYPALARKISPSLGGINSKLLYRKFLFSNINALFLANGFLSYLDRRPLETKMDLNYLWTEVPDGTEVQEEKISMETYTRYALNHYYAENPDVLTFSEPDMPRETWMSKPAFYRINELPAFAGIKDEKIFIKIPNSDKIVFYYFLGIAVGRKGKYIVHHTRRNSTFWNPGVEKSAIRSIQESFMKSGAESTADEALISNAIIVAEGAAQFGKFLEVLEEKSKLPEGEKSLITAPYETIHIIPLNHSGVAELRALMMDTPSAVKRLLRSRIMKSGGELFSEAANEVFPLTYHEVQPDGSAKQIPVFIGHLMEAGEIIQVMKEYRKGTEFLISCYPQQVPYYEFIMPNSKFI